MNSEQIQNNESSEVRNERLVTETLNMLATNIDYTDIHNKPSLSLSEKILVAHNVADPLERHLEGRGVNDVNSISVYPGLSESKCF